MIPARKARPKRARPDQTECWLRRSGAFRSSKGTGRAARAKGLEVSKTKARSSGVRSVVGAGPATALATLDDEYPVWLSGGTISTLQGADTNREQQPS